MTKNVQFSDVPAGKWYETAVKTLASKGVITGYTDGTFKPTKSVTRAGSARWPPFLLPEGGQREVHRCPDHVLGL